MNVIIITGRLGKDPELKTAANGNEYLNFNVAVDRKMKKGEEKKTDWFRCVAFGKLAVFICTYFKKGNGIEIVGRMENDPYKDKETGKTVSSWQLLVETVDFPKGGNKEAPAAPEGFEHVDEGEIPF